MKIISTLLIILLFSANYSQSQILTAPHANTEYTGPDSLKLTAHLEIVNNGSQTLDVVCQRYQVNVTPGHFSYFCWVVCYDSAISLSPSPIQVAPGGSITNFEGWMGPVGTPGHDEVTYRYYDMNGNSDTLYVTFTYDFTSTASGINDLNASKYNFTISGPNPANSHTILNFNLSGKNNSKITVSNLLGKKINEYPVTGKMNSIVLPVADLNSGIYIYSLSVDGVIVGSRKLIVSHQ